MVKAYRAETAEQRVNKEYANMSSMKAVVDNFNGLGFEYNGRKLVKEDITNIIKSKTRD